MRKMSSLFPPSVAIVACSKCSNYYYTSLNIATLITRTSRNITGLHNLIVQIPPCLASVARKTMFVLLLHLLHLLQNTINPLYSLLRMLLFSLLRVATLCYNPPFESGVCSD